MFDYVLTGPISGVSAGLYLGGLINEIAESLHHPELHVHPPYFAAVFAAAVTIYFWRKNIMGMHESSEKALRIMQIATGMVVVLIVWCIATILKNGYQPVPFPTLHTIRFTDDSVGWLKGTVAPSITAIAIMIGLGHSLLAMSGFETLAQVYREIAHPKLKNLERAGWVIFALQHDLHVAGFVFRGDDHSRFGAATVSGQPDRRPFHVPDRSAHACASPSTAWSCWWACCCWPGAVNTAIIGSNGVLNRVAEDGVLPDWFRHPHHRFGTTSRLINTIVRAATGHDIHHPRRHDAAGRSVRVRRGLEFLDEGALGSGAALQASRESVVEDASEYHDRQIRAAGRA